MLFLTGKSELSLFYSARVFTWAFFIFKIYQNKFVGFGYCTYVCRMKEYKQRKEVKLTADVLERLQVLADKKKWSLKKYMENVLVSDSNKKR